MIKELLKADEIKVALVAAVCILGSAIIFKRVLLPDPEGPAMETVSPELIVKETPSRIEMFPPA